MPADDPLFLIPAESMSRFLQIYEFPGPSSFVRGDEVRYIPIYCFGLCQHRRRFPQCSNLKIAVRTIPRHGLSRQLDLKTRMMKSTLNPMRPQLQYALFVENLSAVCKSEIGTSNRTFRIRFIAHSRVVPGRVVVNGT